MEPRHLRCLVPLVLCAAGAGATDFLRVASLTLPWAPQVPLPSGVAPGDLSAVAAACAANATCDAYDSHGVMYACGGRCTCETSAAACPEATDGVDLYVKPVGTPPMEWADEVRAANALHSTYPAGQTPCYNPAMANGYLGTTVGWDAIFIQGVFNGACGGIHKARVPSFLLVTIPSAEAAATKLDMPTAVYTTKWVLPAGGVVHQTLLANRAHKHCFQMEFRSDAAVTVPLKQDLALVAGGAARPGAGCNAGAPMQDDFDFTMRTEADRMVLSGRTKAPFDDGSHFNVTVVASRLPATLTLEAGTPASFTTCMASNVDGDALANAGASYDAVSADPAAAAAAHAAAWAALWEAGIEVTMADGAAGAAVNETAEMMLNGMGLGFNTSYQVQAKVNASLYNMYATVRDDWFAGASPGGIQSLSYNGAVFMDMELYMGQSMLLLRPELALSFLKYREASLPTARKVAQLFGYGGAMFPWTAAYKGSAYGCCSGQGGFENCLEQHNVPMTAVLAWQHYLATGDEAYLNTTGMALLEAVAEWIDSRVATRPDGSTTVRGVLPIDEWCVGAGCGCEAPGVDDDAWTNAAMRVALDGYAAAAKAGNRSMAVNATSIPILFDEQAGRHVQFNSPTCPNGEGGSHYTDPVHTVCPEDVLYLGYPARDFLGEHVTAEVLAADVKYYEPRTCRENAGMTTPIHTVVMTDLLAGGLRDPEITVARRDAVYYRALHAVQYGPYHTFNEVDKHTNVVGAHYDNAHFLTGNGGFLNIFEHGFSGLRITPSGLRITPPLPPATIAEVKLRRLAFHGLAFDVTYSASATTFALRTAGAAACVEDGAGAKHAVAAGAPLSMAKGSFAFPGLLTAVAC